MTDWGDVVARARGLSSRLLRRDRLELLARAPDLEHLASSLAERYGTLPDRSIHGAALLEQAVRLAIARELDVMYRWCGARTRFVAPLLADEDRRTLRSLIRRVAAGSAREARLAGLLATPTLPRALLALLARQSRLDALAAALVTWGSPYGSAILPLCTGPRPDLFEIQLAVDRAFAAHAIDAAREAGEPVLAYIVARIDAGNIASARAVARRSVEHDPDSLFVDGGRLVSRAVFSRLARASSASERRSQIHSLVKGTSLAPLTEPGDESLLDDRLLSAAIAQIGRGARTDPLGLSPVVWYLLRLREEGRDVLRIVWSVALGAPPARIVHNLVTAA